MTTRVSNGFTLFGAMVAFSVKFEIAFSLDKVVNRYHLGVYIKYLKAQKNVIIEKNLSNWLVFG
tara:strand:- start:74 stop:265 length:192 start_codon:yes stop_codon:yes gene_type:complete